MQIKSAVAFVAFVLSTTVFSAPIDASSVSPSQAHHRRAIAHRTNSDWQQLQELDARAVTGVSWSIGGNFAKQRKNKSADRAAAKTVCQKFLDTVQAHGHAVSNDLAVTITDNWHTSSSDATNHIKMEFTDAHLCGGKCVAHVYSQGTTGKLWNAAHQQIF